MDDYVELEDHFARCVAATKLLRQIEEDALHMRWQGIGSAPEYVGLEDAINDARKGWLASNC